MKDKEKKIECPGKRNNNSPLKKDNEEIKYILEKNVSYADKTNKILNKKQ